MTGLDVEATLDALAAHGIRTFAADGVGETLLPDVDVSQPARLGHGQRGVGAARQRSATAAPRSCACRSHDRVESLNLAMAATVCLATSAGRDVDAP